jgi:hypothetical protein
VKSGAKSKNKEIHSKSVAFHAKNQQKNPLSVLWGRIVFSSSKKTKQKSKIFIKYCINNLLFAQLL